MENKTTDNSNFIEEIFNKAKKKSNYFIGILTLIILGVAITIFLDHQQVVKNNKISEQYIKANIYLTQKDKENSKNIFKQIIKSEDKFYSILALNSILENNLEASNEEVLKIFRIIENINLDKDKIDLIKLKKALFLIKISKISEGNKLLNELTEKDSVWGKIASDISK